MKPLVTNETLLHEMIQLRKEERSSSTQLFSLIHEVIAERLKLERYRGYHGDIRERMIIYASWTLHRTWKNFNTDKSRDPIGYLTVVVDGCFQRILSEYYHE